MVWRVHSTVAQAMMTAFLTALDQDVGAHKILIYTGSQPASPAAAVTGTLLATFTGTDPGGTVSAVTNYARLTMAAYADVAAVATGTAGWFRMTDNSGDAIADGDVTATGGGGQLTIGSTSITSGGTVSITSLVIDLPKGY